MPYRCKHIATFLFLMSLISCQSKKNFNNILNNSLQDSIAIYLKKSSDKSLDKEASLWHLKKALQLNAKETVDSIRNNNLSDIAYTAYNKKHFPFFKRVNQQALNLSIQIKDSFAIADTHWNYGNYYNKIALMDSAYYHYAKAEEIFNTINDNFYSARMLYNMAIIRYKIKDYTGSEVLTFNAVSKFKDSGNPINLYRCYNNLGVLYKNLEEYESSIFYYNQALNYLKKVDNKKTFKEAVLNNIGLVYHKSKDYNRAINYYNMALLSDNLNIKNSHLFAKLIDNLAYSRFLNGEIETIEKEFIKALSIRDSLNSISDIIINKLHLTEYYAKIGDTLKAINFAKHSKELSKKTSNNRDYLASLNLLSKIDRKNSTTYLNEYVVLSDSLQKEERKIRDKFTRIRFETEEYVEKTKRLSQQRIWILAISIVVILMLLALHLLVRQRSKNKELLFEAQQQAYNEEIYKLLFKQQANINKGRMEERTRISEELHDGILSKLFGTRMGFGFLNITGSKETIQQHKSYINELQEVEKEIRVISHELKNNTIGTEVDFVSLIENLVKKQSGISHFNYKITNTADAIWDRVTENIKINLYRIIQEALSNISKYSKAKNVTINFSNTDKLFILTISDDGVGFKAQKKVKGMGLLNMKSRTQKLNGEFSVASSLSNGTKLTMSINL